MNLLFKLERKFSKYAIYNLMLYIVALYIFGLALSVFMPGMYYQYLSLDFEMIFKGQIWRLITFIIPAEAGYNFIFFIISVYFYYIIGNTLERNWGAFRLNLYFFSGVFFNIIAALISYLINGYSFYTASSLDFICSTMFFAFAALFPNTAFYIYFLIPVKAKYLAILEGIVYLVSIMDYIRNGQYILTIPIIVAFLNFLIFFFATRNYRSISPNELRRKATFRRKMDEANRQGNVAQFRGRNVITRHKCAVCGRTELDGDNLEFRFCSKCDGNYEYCMDHLFTHEHVKKPE